MGYYDDPATRKFKEQEQNSTAQALLKIIAENDKQAAANKPASVLKDYRSPELIARRKREEASRKAAAAGEDPRITKFLDETAQMDTVVGKDYRSEDAKKASSEALYKRRYDQFYKDNPDLDPAVQKIIADSTVKVKNKDVPAEAVLRSIWQVLSDPNAAAAANNKENSSRTLGERTARQARNKAIDDFNKIKGQLSPELRAQYNVDALEAEGAFKKEAGASIVSNLGVMATQFAKPLTLSASGVQQAKTGFEWLVAKTVNADPGPSHIPMPEGPSADQFVEDANNPHFGYGTIAYRGVQDALRKGEKVPGAKLNANGNAVYTSVDLPGFLPTVRPLHFANTAVGVTGDLIADPLNAVSLGAGSAANASMRALSRAGEHALLNKIQSTGVKSLTAAEKAGGIKVLEDAASDLSRTVQKAGGKEAFAAGQWAALEKSGQSGIRIGGKTVIPSGMTAIDTGLRKAFTPAAKLVEKIDAIRGGAKVVEEVGREFGPEDISRSWDKIGVDGPKAPVRTAEEATQLAATHQAAVAARDAAFGKAQSATAAASAETHLPHLKEAAVAANAEHAAAVRAADAVDPAKLAANPNHGAVPAFVQERNLPYQLHTAPAYYEGKKNRAVRRVYGFREVEAADGTITKRFTLKDGKTIRVPVERPRGLPGSEGSWRHVPESTKIAAHNENSRMITVGKLKSRPTDDSLLIDPHSDVKDLIRVGEHVPGLYGILKEIREDGLWLVQADRSLFKVKGAAVPDGVAAKLAAAVDGTGGFIADPTTGASATEGFAVTAERSPAATVPTPQVTDSLIADFVETNGSFFEDPAHKLRVRTDSAENSVIDVVEVFDNEADALAAAAARGDADVRDLANNKMIPAGGTGTAAAEAPVSPAAASDPLPATAPAEAATEAATDAEKLAARDATIAARDAAMGPVPDTPVDPLRAAADRRSAAKATDDTLPVTGPKRSTPMPRLGDDAAVMKWWRDLFVRRGNIRAAERSGAVRQGSADVLHRGLTVTKRRAENLSNDQATRIQATLDAGVKAVGADDMWKHFNNAFDPAVAPSTNPRTGLPRAGKTLGNSPVTEVVDDLRAMAAAELDPNKAADINKFADMLEGSMSDVANQYDEMYQQMARSKAVPESKRASEQPSLDVGRAGTRALPPRTLSEQGQKAIEKMDSDQLEALNMLDAKGKRKIAGETVLGESGILQFPTPTVADPAKYVEIDLAGSTQEISDSIVAAMGDDFKKGLGIEDGDPFNMLDNVAQSYAYGSRDAFRSISDQQMLQHFAKNDIVHVIYKGVDGQAPAPKGWEMVESYSVKGEREVWAEPTIAEEMKRNASIIRNDKELRQIKKTADEVSTFLVRQFMSPTTKLVGFQMRNATTNNIMYAYFGGTLSGMKEAWRLMTGPMRNINTLIKTDGMSFEQAIAHLVKTKGLSERDVKIIEKIRELSVTASGQQRTLLSKNRVTLRTEYGGKAVAKRALSPSDPGFIPNRVLFKPGEAINRGVEDFSRVALFVSIFDKTGNFDTALEIVNRGLIDYTDITRFETTSIRRWMAFYTYLRKNTAAMVQVAMDNPVYINRTLRAKQALSDNNDDLLTSSDKKRGNQQSGGLMRAIIGGPSAFKLDDPVTGSIAAVNPFFQGAYWGLDKASFGKIYGSLPPSERPKFTDISSSVVGMAAGGPAEFITAIYELSTGRNFKTGAKFEGNEQLMALVNGILPVWEQGLKLKNDVVQGDDMKRRTSLVRLLAGITTIEKGSEESKYLVLNAMRQDWDYNIKELNKGGGTIPDWQTLVDAGLFKKIQPPRTVQPTTDMKKATAIKTLTTPTTQAERDAAVKRALSFAPTTTTVKGR